VFHARQPGAETHRTVNQFDGSQALPSSDKSISAKSLDTEKYRRKFRAPMNHESISFCTRQRSALQVCAGKTLDPCGAPPRALEVLMR
jgi:hypothetical protein